MSLKIIINQERTIPISMVTREVSCRSKIHSFKIKVICHIIGNGNSVGNSETQKLITLNYSKAIFVFLCFPIFQTSLVNRQNCASSLPISLSACFQLSLN